MSKILLFDIETMANEAWIWGYYEQTAIEVIKPWYMITFAYKWLGEKKVHSYSLPEFKGYIKNKPKDKRLCKELWKLFNEADIVMAHNGYSFDIKKAQMRFVKHGFKPTTPFQQIDTLKVARKHFKFDCNKLDKLAREMGVGRKLPHEGWDLWKGCAVYNNPQSWRKMIRYNKQDVRLLEEVYYKFRPYMTGHPNLNLLNSTLDKCEKCGGVVARAGVRPSLTGKWQRLRCTECGGMSQQPIMKNKQGIVRG